jgi:preprotein translocase subunit SecG
VAILVQVCFVLAAILAIVYSLLVLVTGKGDAMSGGGGIRTTFKGKASFDDIISRVTLGVGIAFMVVVLMIDVIQNRFIK